MIDDDPVMREILQGVLSGRGHTVELAENLDTARVAVSRHAFDLIFLDLVFSQQHYSGFDIMKCIRKRQLFCPMVLITSHPSTISAVEALREHAFDYLVKPLKIGELVVVTDRALRYNSKLAEARRLEERMGMRNICMAHITDREKDVLTLFAKGFSYAEVAEHLGIKLSTLQTYTKSIYKKLGVHSRTEAVHEALCLSLIEC
ncbi:MAG TPA: response regulator transcription factor [Mariprofundaceae bacterium]|nr:response regulator transcription factor [Mariprofundaceae bacterium]